MSRELEEAMDALPNVTEAQIEALIEFQIQELSKYSEKGTRAKKNQSEEDVELALTSIIQSQSSTPPQPASKFPRRA